MANVDAVIDETKRAVKKYEGEIKGAERLTRLLEGMNVPVTEEKARIAEMKAQAKDMKKALTEDKKVYG